MQSVIAEESMRLQQEQKEQKAQREAFWEAKRNNLKTVTTRKPHVCAGCKVSIPAGTKAKICSALAAYGSNYYYGFTTKYFCLVCRPVAAKVEA